MGHTGRDHTLHPLLEGWGRIGYARIAVAAAMGLFAVTDRPGFAPHAWWIEEIGLSIAILIGMVGVVQATVMRRSLGGAKIASVVSFAAAISFIWIFSYDPRQYAYTLVLLAVIEVTVLFGRRGAVMGWLVGVTSYLAATLIAASSVGATVDPPGVALRVVLTLALAIGADTIVGILRHESRRLQRSEDLFRTVFERAPVGIALADVEHTAFLSVNSSYADMLGYVPAELIGRTAGDFTVPEEWIDQRSLQEEVLSGEREGYEIEKHYLRRDGTSVPALTAISLVRDPQGAPQYWIGMVNDITEREAMERSVADTNEGLRTMVAELERRNVESATLAELGELLAASDDVAEAQEVLTRLLPRLFPDDAGSVYAMRESRDAAVALATWNDVLPDERSFAPESCWAIRRGHLHAVHDPERDVPCGHVRPMAGASYLCVPMTAHAETIGVVHLRRAAGADPDDGPEHLRLAQAVAERIGLALSNFRLRETLLAQSLQDPLTGLYNRRFMSEFLERELHRGRRMQRPLSVLMVDVDRLKHYNDTFGHQMGDRLIRETASVLLEGIRASDLACRYGGDEFIVVLPETAGAEAAALAARLLVAFSALDLGADAAADGPGLSIGVATAPDHGWEPEVLISVADQALYAAKTSGRNAVVAAPGPAPAAALAAAPDPPPDSRAVGVG